MAGCGRSPFWPKPCRPSPHDPGSAGERGLRRRIPPVRIPVLPPAARPYALVDERLCAEDDGECEPFGVLGAGFGGVDRDPQVVAGDDEGVAVECDESDVG